MENIKKTILGILGAVFLISLLGAPVLGDLDGIDSSDIITDNCDGARVNFKLYTNSQNDEYSAPVTVNTVTKYVTIPAEHGYVFVTFLAEDILSSMQPGTETVTIYSEDYSGNPVNQNVKITVVECGIVCNVAPRILDDVRFKDEVSPDSELEVKISLDNIENKKFHDIQLRVWIEDQYNDRLGDRVEPGKFNLNIDDEEEETVILKIPADASEGMYTLYVRADASEGCLFEESYDLEIKKERYSLKIDRIGFPSEVKGGDDFSLAITLLNNGRSNQQNVRLSVSINELDLSQTSQYFNIREDEKVTQYFTLTIPEDVKKGEYSLRVTATSERVTESKEYLIRIHEAEVITEPRTDVHLSVLESTKTLTVGTGEVYRVNVRNTGDYRETLTFKVAGIIGWGTSNIEPQIATIASGESEEVYIYVTPKDQAKEQEYSFTFYVQKEGASIASVTLKAIIEEEERKAFTPEQMGVWIFVIIIIAIAILFSVWTYTTSAKEDKKEAKKESKKDKEKYY